MAESVNGNNASYSDSRDNSPRSRGTDCDNNTSSCAAAGTWDDVPPPLTLPLPPQPLSHRPAHRLKFMCSYGGRIQPRPHDNQLAYVGGDTKIVAVDRSVRYPQLLARLAALIPPSAGDVCFKYQLPGEDLDSLISVSNDEDIDHMLVEYDHLQRSSAKPTRLRLFIFPFGAAAAAAARVFISSDSNSSDRHWFVEALNSAQAPPAPPTDSLPPPVPVPPPGSGVANPDFLFGLDKGIGNFPSPLMIHHPAPLEPKAFPEASPIDGAATRTTESDSTKEDNWIGGGGGEPPVVHQPETQRQIPQLQTLHIARQQETSEAVHQEQPRGRNDEETLARAHPDEYYLPPTGQVLEEAAPPVPQISVAYLQQRIRADGGGVYSSIAGLDRPPVYLIPSPSQAPQSMYSGTLLQALTSEAGQGYYQQPAYVVAAAGAPPQPAARTVGAYAKPGLSEANGSINTIAPQLLATYNSTGRPLYYVGPAPAAGGSVVMPAYQIPQTATSVEAGRSGATPYSTPPPAQPASTVATIGTAIAAATTAQLLKTEAR